MLHTQRDPKKNAVAILNFKAATLRSQAKPVPILFPRNRQIINLYSLCEF